jgi:aminoglycoside phosphotransferase (APT) family kinase protein
VYRWLPGRPLTLEPDVDRLTLAEDIARFLRALWAAPATGGPAPGTHNFFRGAPPAVYEEEALAAFAVLDRVPDVALAPEAAHAIWRAATASRWTAPPVWFHGDVAVGNLLVRDGRLCAVIDFGTSGVGDPACDLVPYWTFFDPPAAEVFRAAVDLDDATWARAAGWALWKAAITVRDRPDHAEALHTLARLAATDAPAAPASASS